MRPCGSSCSTSCCPGRLSSVLSVLLTRARRWLRDLELFGPRHASEQRRESARALRSMASFFD